MDAFVDESLPFWFVFQLVLEGVHSRQIGDALLMEKRMLDKSVQQTKKTVDFYNFKASRIEDQVVWVAYIGSFVEVDCINNLFGCS